MGKIFVLFETPEGASKTLKSLSGKHFGGRTVVANFFSEEKRSVSNRNPAPGRSLCQPIGDPGINNS